MEPQVSGKEKDSKKFQKNNLPSDKNSSKGICDVETFKSGMS